MGRAGRFAIVWFVLVALAGAPVQAAERKARTTCTKTDLHGDARLGPRLLPSAGPLAKVLKGYRRFAGMSSRRYLRSFWDTKAKSWRYPPQGGYQVTPEGRPVRMQLSLFAGQRVDRFGSDFGAYLSPEGTPYAARAIPPQSLDNAERPSRCNYSRFKVLRDIPVYSGPIAAGLGQPGFGLQYVLDATIFPGAPDPATFNVRYLLSTGHLQRIAG